MRFVRQQDNLPEAIDPHVVRDAVGSFPVSLVVVFGSYATDGPHPLSDLDVAVEFERSVTGERKVELLPELTVAVQDATGIEAVDIVDLDEVGPAVGYAALARGTVVSGDHERAVDLETKFLHKKLDFRPVKRQWDAALTERIQEGTFGRR